MATTSAAMVVTGFIALPQITGAAPTNQFFGAIYTSTIDGGSVNGNLYPSKDAVFLNGGPQNANGNGLPNGTYYFQVTNPSGSVLLSTDAAVCRQVVVANGVVSGVAPAALGGGCTHVNGTQNPANLSTPVSLMPYDDTPNGGGEYKLWLIRQASTTTIAGDGKAINFIGANVKTDNFKVEKPVCTDCDPTFVIFGEKYYDANANSVFDDGEVPVPGVKILINYTAPDTTTGSQTVYSGANGKWASDPIPAGSTYTVTEETPTTGVTGYYWVQTGPVADSQGVQGYSGTASTDVGPLRFGNICFGPATGGLTLGFWSNKNGSNTMTKGDVDTSVYVAAAVNDPNPEYGKGMDGDLSFLRRLNLKNSSLDKKTGNTSDFNPTTYASFNTWLLNGNAVNMAYMLSVQLSATSLDVRHKSLFDSQLVDAVNLGLGITTIGAVRRSANEELNLAGGNSTFTGSDLRDDEEVLKNFLDGVNNNRLSFAHAGPCPVAAY